MSGRCRKLKLMSGCCRHLKLGVFRLSRQRAALLGKHRCTLYRSNVQTSLYVVQNDVNTHTVTYYSHTLSIRLSGEFVSVIVNRGYAIGDTVRNVPAGKIRGMELKKIGHVEKLVRLE
jgi:hypothetical protein